MQERKVRGGVAKDKKGKAGKSFWETLPGILTALAAFLTAVGGLITLVLSLPRPNLFFPATPTPAMTATPGQPIVLGSSSFRNKLHTNGTLYYYDFDKPEQQSNATFSADFYFKPDNPDDLNTQIRVVPSNGAKFGPRSAGLFPWEVEAGQMTSAGVYSVPQQVDIPCITSAGKYCTFSLRWDNNGDFVVSFKLYELH